MKNSKGKLWEIPEGIIGKIDSGLHPRL